MESRASTPMGVQHPKHAGASTNGRASWSGCMRRHAVRDIVNSAPLVVTKCDNHARRRRPPLPPKHHRNVFKRRAPWLGVLRRSRFNVRSGHGCVSIDRVALLKRPCNLIFPMCAEIPEPSICKMIGRSSEPAAFLWSR